MYAMKRRQTLGLVAAFMLLPLLPVATPAAGATRHGDSWRTWRAHTFETLGHRSDADSLVTSVILMAGAPTLPPGKALALLDRAAQQAPTAPDIAALAMSMCSPAPDCDPLARARRLRALAPDNALSWMPALRAAQQHEDPDKVTRVLQEMARAQQFQAYSIPVVKRMREGLQHVPPAPAPARMQHHHMDPATARTLQTLIFMSAIPLPGYQPVVRACRPDGAAFGRRHAACRRIGGMLERASTLSANLIGLVLLRWTAGNLQQYEQALTTGRDLEWLASRSQSCQDPAHLAGYLDTLMRAGSERAADSDCMRLLGDPVSPPAGWGQGNTTRRLLEDRKVFRNAPDSPAARANAELIAQTRPGHRAG